MPTLNGHHDVTLLMLIAAGIVIASAIFLLVLAAATVLAPRHAARFVKTFASSSRAHITEQVLRLVAGVGLVGYAPHMRFTIAFQVLGWLLIVTSIVLLMIPWQWHHTFGRWAIPLVLRHLKLYGVGAGALGVLILVALII